MDGVLLPFAGGRAAVGPGIAARLAALGARGGAELVWATTWGEEANTAIAPRFGLPALPVLAAPDTPGAAEAEARDLRCGRHWKTRPLVGWAAGRPFVWLDDEIRDADRAWVAAHHPGRALLLRVDPARGLGAGDLDAVEEWAAGLG